MTNNLNTHYYLQIESAIEFVVKNQGKQPSLSEIAQSVGLSDFHFQKIFKRWAGVSPKNLLQYLTLQKTKASLDQGDDILNTSLSAGLSGPSRLHDLFIKFEALTPGEFKLKAKGLKIQYGFTDTPFGKALIATTTRGICHLHFVIKNEKLSLYELKQRFPMGDLIPNQTLVNKLANTVFKQKNSVDILAIGSPFQIKVWEALLKIPDGYVASYKDIATLTDNPKAARAVGSAIASNQIGYLIPCHRVIKSNGIIGNYRWGHLKKQALLCFESAKNNT